MRTDELLVYRLEKEDLLVKAQPLLEEGTDAAEGRKILYGICAKLLETAGESGFYGNLWHCYIADLLVNHENIYSREAEIRGEIEGTVNDAVLHDMEFFFSMFFCDFEALAERWQMPELRLITGFRPSSGESGVYNSRIRDRICALAQEMADCTDAAQMKDAVTQFYKEYGVGRFGLHKAFRVEHGEDGVQIVPIKRILHVYMDDLVGYESAKKKLIENTEAFLKGRPANNVLLFGEAGTGKSSCIKAISNEYYDRGLRIIEIYRHQFKDIHAFPAAVQALLAGDDGEIRLTEAQIAQIEAEADAKYRTWEWIYGHSPSAAFRKTKKFACGRVEAAFSLKSGCIDGLRFSGDFLGNLPADRIADALQGCRYTREAMGAALGKAPVEDCFDAMTSDELTSFLLN